MTKERNRAKSTQSKQLERKPERKIVVREVVCPEGIYYELDWEDCPSMSCKHKEQ